MTMVEWCRYLLAPIVLLGEGETRTRVGYMNSVETVISNLNLTTGLWLSASAVYKISKTPAIKNNVKQITNSPCKLRRKQIKT